jgi:hypothetical protein
MSDTKGDKPNRGPGWVRLILIRGAPLALGAVALAGLILTAFRWPDKAILVEAAALFALAAVGLIRIWPYLRQGEISRSGARSPTPGPSQGIPVAVPPALIVAALMALFFFSAALVAVDRVAGPPGGSIRFVGPTTGQVVYRVYGGKAGEFGMSWTPIDPTAIGANEYRVVAGLPDTQNAGSDLAVGFLDSPSSVLVVRPAEPVSPGDGDGASCSYPGGLIEYVIPHARDHVLAVRTTLLTPPFGGPHACS